MHMKNTNEFPILLGVGLVCAVLAVFGPILHFLLAGAAILILLEGIKAYSARSRSSENLFERYKLLIGAMLCFLFGGVSGFYNIIGIVSLLTFVFNYAEKSKSKIPPAPQSWMKKDTRSTSSGSSGSEAGRGYYANSASSHHTSGTASSKYSKVNDSDIVQQAKAFMQNRTPDLNKAAGRPHASYQTALAQLQRDIREMETREKSVSSFLDDFFEDSTVSKTRYLTVLKNAHARMETNYEKAQQAVKLFGTSEPTKERMEILNRYVQDSSEILKRVDRVINELITVQQNDVISDGDVLDSLLDDLADTTAYYQRSPLKDKDENDETHTGFTLPR